MDEEKQKSKNERSTRLNLSSRFWKIFLVIVAVFLTFAGPTYVVYVFLRLFDLNYFVSMFSGLALFIVGLVLIWYLIRKKAIS